MYVTSRPPGSNAGVWRHWVFTFSGGTWTAYRDGVNLGTPTYQFGTSVNDLYANTSDFNIGVRADGYGDFNGKIQLVNIYDYPLTSSDVSANYAILNAR